MPQVLDRDIAEEMLIKVEKHISECSSCSDFLRQMEYTVECLHSISKENVPAEMKQRVWKKIRQKKGSGQRMTEHTGIFSGKLMLFMRAAAVLFIVFLIGLYVHRNIGQVTDEPLRETRTARGAKYGKPQGVPESKECRSAEKPVLSFKKGAERAEGSLSAPVPELKDTDSKEPPVINEKRKLNNSRDQAGKHLNSRNKSDAPLKDAPAKKPGSNIIDSEPEEDKTAGQADKRYPSEKTIKTEGTRAVIQAEEQEKAIASRRKSTADHAADGIDEQMRMRSVGDRSLAEKQGAAYTVQSMRVPAHVREKALAAIASIIREDAGNRFAAKAPEDRGRDPENSRKSVKQASEETDTHRDMRFMRDNSKEKNSEGGGGKLQRERKEQASSRVLYDFTVTRSQYELIRKNLSSLEGLTLVQEQKLENESGGSRADTAPSASAVAKAAVKADALKKKEPGKGRKPQCIVVRFHITEPEKEKTDPAAEAETEPAGN